MIHVVETLLGVSKSWRIGIPHVRYPRGPYCYTQPATWPTRTGYNSPTKLKSLLSQMLHSTMLNVEYLLSPDVSRSTWMPTTTGLEIPNHRDVNVSVMDSDGRKWWRGRREPANTSQHRAVTANQHVTIVTSASSSEPSPPTPRYNPRPLRCCDHISTTITMISSYSIIFI